MSVAEAVILRCDHLGCEESTDWWFGGINDLKIRSFDVGWIAGPKKTHYCPIHAEDHR